MSFFDDYIDEARKKFGDGAALTGSSSEFNITGIELPALCLRYLLNYNILPMSRIIGVAGAPASFKSSFGFEVLRWFMEIGGYTQLVETENKAADTKGFMGSFIGYGNLPKVKLDSVDSIEDAQDRLSFMLSYYKDKCPKRDVPFCIVVDSLTGAPTRELMAMIDKTGHVERHYPACAYLWTFYLKKLSSDLIGMPITAIFTNHLKDKLQETSFAFAEKPKSKQGGVAQDFHSTHYLYFQRISDIRQANRQGALVSIKAEKCGTGPRGRKIEVPVLWTFDKGEDGNPVQRTVWDWHAATARLLVSKHISTKEKEAIDVECASNAYTSKRLGLKNVSDTEMGQAVFEDKAYLKDICDAMGVGAGRPWESPVKPKTKKKKDKAAEEPAEPAEAVAVAPSQSSIDVDPALGGGA
jgi:RecA/RadA recombinase